MKLGHIGIPVKDLEASRKFYDAVAPHVDLEFVGEHEGFVGYGNDDSYRFYVHTGKPAVSGIHVCFNVETKENVDSFYKPHFLPEE